MTTTIEARGPQPPPPSGPVRVVLVHGVRTSRTMWRRQVALLRAHGYDDVVAVDLPGHGALVGEPFTLDRGREVLDAATADAPGRVAVVGLSLGGYVSMHWAAGGGRCDALVLSSCTARTGGLPHRGFVALSRAIVASGRADRVSDLAARRYVGREAALDVAAGGIASQGQASTLQAMRAVDPLADLRAIEASGVPVTFVMGGWDHFRVDERAFRVAAPSARWVLVHRGNHLVSLHRPRAYGRALLDALSASAPTP